MFAIITVKETTVMKMYALAKKELAFIIFLMEIFCELTVLASVQISRFYLFSHYSAIPKAFDIICAVSSV